MNSTCIGIKTPFGRVKRIIVGIIDEATIPEPDASVIAAIPQEHISFFQANKGKPFPEKYIEATREELDNFVDFLESQGVIVDRPSKIDFSKPIHTPYWSTPGGLYAAMPRDILLVVENKIFVAPMSWRCRYREAEAYQDLLTSYRKLGYEIITAPRPTLKDTLYKPNENCTENKFVSILTEEELVFDAADFIVLDKIIIAQESHVTNKAGISWLENQLKSNFEIYVLEFNDLHRMHIDATFVPLREGLILINPERVDSKRIFSQLPSALKSWEYVFAPAPVVKSDDPPKFMSSDWLSMNILTLDPNTVIVEEDQLPLIKKLKSYQFNVIGLPFKNFQCFGGSFHCAALEIAKE